MIKIVGLGAGDLAQLPLGVYRLLQQAAHIYLRTDQHPVVAALQEEGLQFTSFDTIYEKHAQFEAVYDEIVAFLLAEEKRHGEVVYAVPGHPVVAERTVCLLRESGVIVEVVGGQSFLDATFTAAGFDPVEGFQLLDATAMKKEQIQVTGHLLITQVYDQFSASAVKLVLMDKYPDDYQIAIITNAGMPNQLVTKCPLYELDHNWTVDNLTTLYVPPTSLVMREFWHLRNVFAQLRSPEGCPWDRKQTHDSLVPKMIEEVNEYREAVQENDVDHMIEELGDVLLHVMLSAQVGEDEGIFTIDDVIEGIAEKMIRRHPHVFGDAEAATAEEALALFLAAKAEEKR